MDSLAGLARMASLDFLGHKVVKAIEARQGMRIHSLVWREIVVFQVH